jgi:hypothetical protein
MVALVGSIDAKDTTKSIVEKPFVKQEAAIGVDKLLIVEEPKEVSAVAEDASRLLVDETKAMVHGSERSQLFCKSDIERRGIDSRIRMLDDLISDELTYQRAMRLKVPIDDTIVQDHLSRTLRNFGLKPGDEEMVFAQEGYDKKEGFEQFRIMYGVNMMLDHDIKSNLIVPDEAIINAYNKNPIKHKPACLLETAFVGIGVDQTIDQLQKKVNQFVQTNKGLKVNWSEPYWLKKHEMSKELDFILKMEPNQVRSQKLVNGFQLYRLRKKRPAHTVTFDELVQYKDKKERYQRVYFEITEMLRKDLFEKKVLAYRKSLFKDATVIYF